MNKTNGPPGSTEPVETDNPNDLPPGDHPVEVAARAGFGPLSPAGRKVWHGLAVPCVSCGQLVRRGEPECGHCGQDLSAEMIEKMKSHAGPWYVLEHVRPFPGVTLERIVRQIRRGLITETSIVRGPSTDYQWRFVVEVPGLCRYFGRCWSCQVEVSSSDTRCPACKTFLSADGVAGAARHSRSEYHVSAEQPTAKSAQTATTSPTSNTTVPAGAKIGPGSLQVSGRAVAMQLESEELAALKVVLSDVDVSERHDAGEAPPRIGGLRATWVTLFLLAAVTLALLYVTHWRNLETATTPLAPEIVAGASE